VEDDYMTVVEGDLVEVRFGKKHDYRYVPSVPVRCVVSGVHNFRAWNGYETVDRHVHVLLPGDESPGQRSRSLRPGDSVRKLTVIELAASVLDAPEERVGSSELSGAD